MEIKNAQFVQGYYRNKETVEVEAPKPQADGKVTFYGVSGALVIPAIVLAYPRQCLQFILFITSCVAIAYGISYFRGYKKAIQAREAELDQMPHLIVNDNTAGTSTRIFL